LGPERRSPRASRTEIDAARRRPKNPRTVFIIEAKRRRTAQARRGNTRTANPSACVKPRAPDSGWKPFNILASAADPNAARPRKARAAPRIGAERATSKEL